MKIEVLTLCDYAREENGKFTVIGMYKFIPVPSLPHTLTDVCFAVRLSLEEGEIIKPPFTFELKHGPSNTPIFPAVAIDSQLPGDNHDLGMLNLIIKMQNLVLKEAGEYVITVKSADTEFHSSFFVSKKREIKQISLNS